MEQVGSGSRHKREDAKPFYRNVTVIRNCDFLWNGGQCYMPTQSKLAQIRKSSVLGQYKKRFEFDQNMSKEMVMRKVEETFPYLRNKSYAFKVVTSRPPKCMPTSRIWDGKMIKKNTQGNSALYILEDEETQKNDSSAYLDQPKSKRRNDELTSLDQSQKAGCELSSLGIGTLAISGQEKQPTSSGSNTRNSASHRASASRLALKEFSTAETLGAENGTLQGFIRLPQNQQMNTSNELVVASQRSHQLSSAKAMETSQQFCSNETAREGLNLWSEDPHLSHVTSRPHSPPPVFPDNIESSLLQNTTLAPRPRAMLSSENSEMPQESPHEFNDATNSSAPVALQQLNQLTRTLNDTSATVITQHNVQPCNDFQVRESRIPPGPSVASTTFSVRKTSKIAASVALSSLNQPTLSDTSATIMVQNTLQPPNDNPIQDFSLFPGPSAAMVDMAKPQNFTAAVAFPNTNQPSSSDSSATFMVQNNMEPWNDFLKQDYNNTQDTSVSTPNFSTTELQNAAPADDDSNMETIEEQMWKGMTDSGNSQMADDNDHTVASLNINQPTSSESSAAFMDQNNMYPLNDSPMPDYTALLDIVMSDSLADNHSTTSGISGLDHNLSLDDLSPHEDEHFDFSVTPKKVPLQGAAFCRFSSSRALPGNVQFAVAVFELNLGTVEVRRFGEDSLIGERIPPSNKPGKVKISLRAGKRELGEAEIWYYHKGEEAVEQIIKDPESLKYFFQKYSEMLSNRNNTTASEAEAQNSGTCGSTEPEQMLCVLVYAAAEIGGQQFIEMIFNSSVGRVVYDRYKDSSALPEAIAREYGHEMTATFLEEITSRFSKEASEAQNYPQTIDWSELVRAAEEAQKQPGLNTEEESNHLDSNVVKDTGYLGDIDTSSNESCESGSSESEDNIPWATSKEMNYRVDELSEIASAYEDQEFGIKKAAVSQSLMYFCENGHFKREKVNSTVSKKDVLPTLEGWQLSLFIREASGLKHLRSLNRCDTSFFLGPEQESIQYRIITEYEKWCLLFKYMKYSWLHSRKFAAEGGQFVEKFNQETQAVMMGASFGCTEDLRIQSTRGLVTTSENPGLAVQRNSTQGLTKHCTSSDLWVLTCLCRPTRNILFVYVADNGDILPQKAYFDDDRYELSIQYWQWQRYCSSLSDVQNRLQEMRKLSEEMRPEFGPTPLPTYNAKMLPQVQDKHMIRQPECCPTWLYTMIHQCWIYAPVERPPFIAILDGISSRTLGAHSIVTWLSHCNQGRYLPPDKCQSEDPYLVNDKTNHPSFNVNVTDYRSARKEKLYEEHLHLDDGGNVIFTDKHPLVRGRKNNEKGLPLITGHPPAKIFYRISEGIADAQNEVNVETSSIYPPGCKEISRKQIIGLHDKLDVTRCWRKLLSESLADSTSPIDFTLTVDYVGNSTEGCFNGYWGKGLGEGLAKSEDLARGTSLTAFNYDLNEALIKGSSISDIHQVTDLSGDWGKGLAEDLAKSKSFTAFTLTVNSADGHLFGDWGKGLGEGLAKSTSLTAFTLTVNSVDGYLHGDWGKGLGEGLAKSTSLTAFTLTVNSVDGDLYGDWGKGLGEGLAKSTSLTAFTLTVNGVDGHLYGDWGKGLGKGLAKSTSLTAFTLTVNSVDGDLFGNWGEGLGEGLAKSTSLTAFALIVNGVDGHLGGDWGKGLGEGLAESTSLTTFTLTVNSVDGHLYEDWGKEGEGLGKSKSLSAFTQTVNSVDRHLYVDWGKGLGEGLAKSKSITVFTLISVMDYCLIGGWVEALRRSLRNSKFLLSDNVRIADSSSLDGCFSSFDLNRSVRGSPPSRSFNPREKAKIKSMPDVTGSSEEATDCILIL